MTELERLKQAMEAGAMAAITFPWPERCADCCYCDDIDWARNLVKCRIEGTYEPMGDGKFAGCEATRAIGIIEPNGHVRYLWEGEE